MTLPVHVSVAVIGSGFAGLGTAICLKQAGRHDFVVLERASDVGGTWRDNSYPGCACDVPSHLYSFSFAPNPSWSRSFSPQPEIQAYLRRTARASGVLPHVQFDTELLDASWQPEQQRWRLSTTRGELTADVVVVGTGPLSEPTTPDLKGLSSFEGTTFHSARWDHSWSPKGRRVAVIGTGASAIQFVPHLQPDAARLVLFQRTAPWVLPRVDRSISRFEQRLYARLPLLQKAVRAAIYSGRESHLIGFRYNQRLMRLAEKLATNNLEKQVADPVLRAKLTPQFTLGCKRVLLSSTYYRALAAPNADVVTDPIVEVVTNGVVTEAADGTRSTHEVDTIVFGTGFHVTDPPVAQRIRVGGRSLTEHWATGGMQALHGLAVHGFPNLFFLVGPNTGLGHNSIVLMIEAQIGHLLKALDAMDAGGFGQLEARADVQASYNARLQRELAKTVWNRGGCQSWYLDEAGRNTTLWPTFTWIFRRELADFSLAEYDVAPRLGRRAATRSA
ncbi:MAG: dependent oxidoreductase [Frankiales bacterium]|nr:dependent oxidoreductase [Frankiales bacterium]